MTCQDREEALAYAREMVRILRDKMKDTVGVQSVTTDGLSVTYAVGGADGMTKQLRYWEKQVLRLQGGSGSASSIDLSGGL